MSTRVTSVRYGQYRNDFLRATKRVLKKQISKNVNKHIEYATAFTNTYNIFTIYAKQIYNEKESEEQESIKEDIGSAYHRVKESFAKLNIQITLENRLGATINEREVLNHFTEEQLKEYNERQEEINKSLEGGGSDTDQTETEEEERKRLNEQNRVRQEEEEERKKANMEQRREFMKTANGTINRNYKGDPLGLTAFINAVQLLKTMAEDNQAALLFSFVKAKLEGKALEAVDDTVDNIDELIRQLKAKIRPDNSKVISGKMMALKMQRQNPQTFAKEAEELADALQRSLVIEGISYTKANEMTIDKTIEMCRASAKSDVVRSILGAAQFTDPKEVVAKLLVETATDHTEKQVFAFEKYNNNKRNGNNRRNDRRPWRGGRGRYNRSFDSSNGYGGNRNNSNYGNQNSNGRGYRGNRGRNGRGNGNNSYNQYNNGGRNYNVRRTENIDATPVVNLGNPYQGEQNNRRNF